MGKARLSSIELKKRNIIKLIKQVEAGKTTLKDAEINRRLHILREESEVGEMWADDLNEKYIKMVKNLNA